MNVGIRKAVQADIIAVKLLADAHREELGFHARQAFVESIAKGELLVAEECGRIVGFTRFHHRRDGGTTLYEIATSPDRRSAGVGRSLIEALRQECLAEGSRRIRLSCPVELAANAFYETIGFQRIGSRSQPGKRRPLYQWELLVLPPRPLRFVASITASTNDLYHMVRQWESEGLSQRPFDWCIVTPLFADPGALQWIRHMHDRWGVDVIFDSGGFFVQQGKIAYDELFSRLLVFYEANPWAAAYVLPDYVPTSRQSEAEVTERVYVTAAEGVKFLRRLSAELRPQAVGVLQGHTFAHLAHCFEAFMEAGIGRIGFGSFDTGGVNSEINLLTDGAYRRLDLVRRMIAIHYYHEGTAPDLHLFGVSTPNALDRFPSYLATSYDSSGWMRTAGLGNIYLPFQGRKNVSHKSSALMSGRGLSAAAFYAECERTGHTCPFCNDYARLQEDRFARMWHNALVFGEMTVHVNRSGEPSPVLLRQDPVLADSV